MRNKSHYRRMAGFMGVTLGIVLASILIFFFYFRKQEISNDITHWGAFGDYLGGVLNPIISFFSLILLGYLTYILSDSDIQENKELQFKIKRNEAYISLTKNNQSITSFIKSMGWVVPRVAKFAHEESNEFTRIQFTKLTEIINKEYNDAKSMLNQLASFQTQYGHLFKYDFRSQDHIRLKELLNKNVSWMNNLMEAIHSLGFSIRENQKEIGKLDSLMEENHIKDIKELSEKIANFLNSLRKEL